MKKILCIGEALIDMICTDKGKTLSEGNHFLKKAGGAPTNVAAAIAALGGNADVAAKVGVDPFGKHLIEVMQSFGISTKWVIQDKNNFTTFAFVSLMENGERDFYFNRGADGQLSEEDIAGLDLSNIPSYILVQLPLFFRALYNKLILNCLIKHSLQIFLSVLILITGIYYFSIIRILLFNSPGFS